jgi:hypothetical protein
VRQKLPLVLGPLGLVLGLVLLTQSVGRLRAEPAAPNAGVCPCVDLSEATTSCAVSYWCEQDADCGDPDHWLVETFPKECLSVKPTKRLCNSVNSLCKTFLNCVWEDAFGCETDLDNPFTGGTYNALKLFGGDCSSGSNCPS